MNGWSILKLFCMVALSDVRPLYMYMHTFQNDEFMIEWVNFYLKRVNLLVLLSIYLLFVITHTKFGLKKSLQLTVII